MVIFRVLAAGAVMSSVMLGCGADGPSDLDHALDVAVGPPAGFSFLTQVDPASGLPTARDFNPDPHIVEIVLVAAETDVDVIPGAATHMSTYNGLFPGPQIVGEVGDTIVAHVFNRLPTDTTIHWHGVEVSALMDGSPISQVAISAGAQFRYEFKMLTPAFYWYHPHVRTDKQIESGLQGTLVVRDPGDQSLLGIPLDKDRTFQLDDILLGGHAGDPNSAQLAPFALDSDYLDDAQHTPAERAELIFNGRDDDRGILLVNGRGVLDAGANPEQLPTVHVRRGVPERWRFVNTANGRFMRISVAGQILQQIASDGGLLEHPIARQPIDLIPDQDDSTRLISNPDPELGVFLSVGERAEVVYVPQGQPGDVSYLEWHDYPRGRHKLFSPGEMMADGTTCPGPAPCFEDHPEDGKRPPRRMLRIVVDAPDSPPNPYSVPTDLRTIRDIRVDADLSNSAQALPIIFGHASPTPEGLVPFFSAVQRPTELVAAARAATGPVAPPAFGPAPLAMVLADPKLALWTEVGETRYWEAMNFTGNDHPFHTHGFFFEPIETRYVDLDVPANNRVAPFPYLELKDTVRLPKRPGALARSWTITRMAVKFSDEDRPPALRREFTDLIGFGGDPTVQAGGWFDHCHIDEHAGAGMATFLNIVRPGYPIPTR